MAQSIKDFFKRKKTELKFKSVGPGRVLGESSAPRPQNVPQHMTEGAAKRTQEQERQVNVCLEAAYARMSPDVNWSASYIKAQAKKEIAQELEAEIMSSQAGPSSKRDPYTLGVPMLAVTGVFFKCPLIGPEVDSYQQIQANIRSYLQKESEEEPVLASILTIHSCNPLPEKKAAVDTLEKYITNILHNPQESKYRKIRLSNKVFIEKISHIEGAVKFLESIGFIKTNVEHEGEEQPFYVYPEDANLDELATFGEALANVEPLKPELDRSLQVLMPAVAAKNMDLPDDFFKLSVAELKKEHEAQKQRVEQLSQMRTKEQRHKDDVKALARKYIYTLIRIKLPNDIILQGTFSVWETLEDVFMFIKENLEDPELEFTLKAPGEKSMSSSTSSLVDLQLVPASILNLNFVNKDVVEPYLKADTKALLQVMD